MRRLTYATVAVLLGVAAPAAAVEITVNPVGGRAQAGLDVLYTQGPHEDRDARIALRTGYVRYLGVVIIGGDVVMAPDTGANSGDVSVYESFYFVQGYAGIAWPALFRFTAVAGPLWVHERIRYVALGDEESFTDSDWGMMARLGLDYAFGDTMEVTFSLGGDRRLAEAKSDLFYGLGVGVNL